MRNYLKRHISTRWITLFLVCLMLFSYGLNISACSENTIYGENYSVNSNNTPMFFPEVDEQKIKKSTQIITLFGERKIASSNSRNASLFIKNQMLEAGLKTSLENYTIEAHTPRGNIWNASETNVVGIKEGTLFKDQIILVTAHYDSLIEPLLDPSLPDYQDFYEYNASGTGADDNAAGVAAMLETARVLQNRSFNRTVYFIAFSGEEEGLFGSRGWLETHPELHEKIIAVINLDCVGRANLVVCSPNYWLQSILNDSVRDLNILCNFHDSDGQRGDQCSFLECRIPAVLICHSENIRHAHTLNDTVDKVDFSVVKNASLLTARILLYLADTSDIKPPTFSLSVVNLHDSVFELNYNVSENSSVEVFINNQGLGFIESGRKFSFPKGTHTLRVHVTDRFGNQGSKSIKVVSDVNISQLNNTCLYEPAEMIIIPHEKAGNKTTYLRTDGNYLHISFFYLTDLNYSGPLNYAGIGYNFSIYNQSDINNISVLLDGINLGFIEPYHEFSLTQGQHSFEIYGEGLDGKFYFDNVVFYVEQDKPYIHLPNPELDENMFSKIFSKIDKYILSKISSFIFG